MKIIANVYITFFITVKKLLHEKFSRPKLCTKFDVNYTYYDKDYFFYNPWFFPKYGKRVFEQFSNLAKGGLGFPQRVATTIISMNADRENRSICIHKKNLHDSIREDDSTKRDKITLLVTMNKARTCCSVYRFTKC